MSHLGGSSSSAFSESAQVVHYLDDVIRKNAALELPGIGNPPRSVALPIADVYLSPLVEVETQQLRWWRKKDWGESEEQYRRRMMMQEYRRDAPTRLAQVVKRTQRLALLGAPGSGKTTALRFLAYQFAKALRERRTHVLVEGEDYGAARLPLLLRIAAYAEAYFQSGKTLDLRTFLSKAFADVPVDQARLTIMINQVLDRGEALVLLDGLDEIFEAQERREIVQRIEEFTAAYRRNVVLVSSRLAGYEEACLRGLFTHSNATLLDWEPAQGRIFLERWCPVVERLLHPDASPAILAMLVEKQQKSVLRAYDAMETVQSFAKNPRDLILLGLIARQGSAIPNRRAELYAQAASLLLRAWQTVPADTAPLDAETTALLLMELARRGQDEEAEGPFRREWVTSVLVETLAFISGRPPRSDQVLALQERFFRSVASGKGVFVERGPGRYAFIDADFEAYFAARWLMHAPQKAAERIHQRRHRARWQASILSAIGGETPESAAALTQDVILGTRAPFASGAYEEILHRDLLLAADCLGDGAAFDADLTRNIVNRLVDIVLQRDGVPEATLVRITAVFCSLRFLPVYRAAQARLFTALEDVSLPHEVRREVVRILDRTGVADNEVIVALLGALKDEDPVVRVDAAQVIRRIGKGNDVAISGLIAMLSDPVFHVRRRAIEILHALKAGRAEIEKALGIMVSDAEFYIRYYARQEREYRYKEAEEAGTPPKWLTFLFPQRDPAAYLGRLKPGDPAAVPILLRALNSRELASSQRKARDFEVNGKAKEALKQIDIGVPAVVRALFEELKKGEHFWSSDMEGILVHLGTGNSVLTHGILEMLTSTNDTIRETAVAALGELGSGDPEVVRALLERIQDTEDEIADAAVEALGEVGAGLPGVATALLKAMQERESVHTEAVDSLGRIGIVTPEVVASLLEALQDSNWWTRKAGVNALRQLGVERSDVVKALLRMLREEHGWIRTPVAEALERIGTGDADAMEAFWEVLKDGRERLEIHQAAVRAIHRAVIRGTVDRQEAMSRSLAMLQAAHWRVRLAGVEALGHIGAETAEVTEALQERLKDEVRKVRIATVEALGRVVQRTADAGGLETGTFVP